MGNQIFDNILNSVLLKWAGINESLSIFLEVFAWLGGYVFHKASRWLNFSSSMSFWALIFLVLGLGLVLLQVILWVFEFVIHLFKN